MKCMYCGKEIPDGSKFCPFCGASLETSNVSNQIKEGSGGYAPAANNNASSEEAITPENFRSLPTYIPRLNKMTIFSAISFAFFVIALFGSLMVKILGDGKAEVPGIILLIIGLTVGIVFLVLALSLNKKVFPQVYGLKIKGRELLPVLFITLGMVCGVVAGVLQGIILMIY